MHPEPGNWTEPTERAGRSKIRLTGWITTATAVAVVLLLAAPPAGALRPNVTTLKAPFTTAVVTLTNPASHSGGGKVTMTSGAAFNKTTGTGGFSDNASSTLRTTSANNSALATGRIQVNLPITITTTGRHTITAVWITVATGSVNLTPGKCLGNASLASSSCTRFAQAFVVGFAVLVDRTNGSQTRVQNWPGNHTSVWSNTTCAFLVCKTSSSSARSGSLHTGKAFWAWDWTSVALNSSHKYTIQMFLFGGSQVTLSVVGATLSGASGNAQLNSATAGNHEILSSVSIT